MRKKVEQVYSLVENECNRRPFQAEMDIVITFLLRLTADEIDNYVPVINKIVFLYNNSKVSRVYNYRTYTSISIFRLKPEYKRVAEERNKELYKELIEFCIETGKGSAIVGISWEEGRGHNIEDPLKKRLFYMSYMFADLYFHKDVIKKKHYEKLFPPVV